MSKQAKTKAKEFFDDSIDEARIKAEIEQLVPLPLPIYLKKRRECASRLKMNVSDIERLVSARKKENKKAANGSAALKADLDELRSSARHIIEHPDILSLFAKEFDKVVAGEVANGKLLYLVATSRLFDKTMSAAIKGTSAGGKSEIRKRILGSSRRRTLLPSPACRRSR